MIHVLSKMHMARKRTDPWDLFILRLWAVCKNLSSDSIVTHKLLHLLFQKELK